MPQPLADVVKALGRIAPLHLAEPWDKVGLLVAGDGRAVVRAMLAIDVTPDVLAEAIAARAELVVGYHPLLFKPLDRLDGATWQGRVALDAVRAGIAIYSPHTALDAVAGGINDWLVECVGGGAAGATGVRALQPAASRGGNTHKIVTFVPESALAEVRTALAEAEAGQIGAYTHCSFSSRGEGTFFGGEGANPAVGKAGHLERVSEARLEMSFHKRDLGAIVAALRTAADRLGVPALAFTFDPHPAAVLRPGGALLAGFCNPVLYICDQERLDDGELFVRHKIPYSDLSSLTDAERARYIDDMQPMEFGHSLTDQIGGQLDAGFMLAGFYEDIWPGTLLNDYLPTYIATRAIKPAGSG